MRGSASSQRPISTFCWLPPRERADRMLEARHADLEPARPCRCASCRSAPKPQHAGAADAAQDRRASGCRGCSSRAAALRSCGPPARARCRRCAAPRRAGCASRTGLPFDRDRAAARALRAEQHRRTARGARARPARRRRAPRPCCSVNETPRTPRPASVLHGERRLAAPAARAAADSSASTRRPVISVTASPSSSLGEGADMPAAAKHRDAVGDVADLVPAMRGEDDAGAALAQPPDLAEQPQRPRARPARRWARRAAGCRARA